VLVERSYGYGDIGVRGEWKNRMNRKVGCIGKGSEEKVDS
jgi:hypothetical protein